MGSLTFPENTDKDELRQAYQAAMTLLDSGISQWAGMNATQKNAWIAANFEQVLRGQRGILRILGKMLG